MGTNLLGSASEHESNGKIKLANLEIKTNNWSRFGLKITNKSEFPLWPYVFIFDLDGFIVRMFVDSHRVQQLNVVLRTMVHAFSW